MIYLLKRKLYGDKTIGLVAKKMGNDVEVLTKMPDMPLSATQEPRDGDLVVRWGCTATIPKSPSVSLSVANKAFAIHRVYDKAGFRSLLSDNDLAPKTFSSLSRRDADWVPDFSGPVVLRPIHHHQGEELYVCDSPKAFFKAWGSVEGDFYLSEVIDKKREFRVVVLSGRVGYVYEKFPTKAGQVAWGGEDSTEKMLKWSEWPIEVCRYAVKAFDLSGLDFGAVDVVVDSDRPYVLEINTAPDVRSEYRQEKFAKYFDFLAENSLEKIPLGDEGTWKSLIHPMEI